MKFALLNLPEICIDFAEKIDSYQDVYDSINLESIYEPIQLRQIIKNKMSVVITSHEDLIAWQKEIAFSCVVKMRKVEESIYFLLKERDLYSIAILLRHHMELAGLMTLSVDVLSDSLKSDDFDKLTQFITKTWFGSSFYNNPKFRDSEFAFGTTETVTVSAMIKSLDKFIDNFRQFNKIEFPENVFTKNYSWLCQIAHPNSASSAFFTNSENATNGFNVTFKWTGDFDENKSILAFLNALYFNLAIGLTNFYLMLSYSFHEDMSITQDENIAMKGYYEILNRFK